MRSIARIAILVLLTSPLLADEPAKPQPGSVVSIPLSVYDEMRKSGEAVSATVIDTMTMAGTFHDRNLTITLAGRSVGARAAVSVIEGATDVTLYGCTGDALLLRGGKGAFQVVALAPSFTLKCDARLSGSDRLEMSVQPSVLAVRSAVTDGELVAGDEDDKGARAFTLVRQVVGANETLETTATGRYLVTLLPDTSRFRYAIQVHNPNRATSPLPLKLVSNEHLQQIDSSAPYEVKDGSYVFAMPPGDSTITLTGELKGTSFAPPVAASLQYAVIESHPLLRPAVQGAPKRVSTGETGISTTYRGAVAFEIGPNERTTWNVTRLEALRAISYAVKSASHTFFVPANGPILGQSEFALDNQGAPELVLPPKPEPTFVSLANEPVLMTKNAKGDLTVPLSAGDQQVTVQHRQATPHWGVLLTSLDVPQVPVPATYTTVELRYPAHWLPIWQSFATQGSLWRPETDSLLLFLLLAIWLERVLAFLTLKTVPRIAVALLLAFASMIVPTILWLTVLAALATTVAWLSVARRTWSTVRLVLAATALFVAGLIWVALTLDRKLERSTSSSASYEATSTAAQRTEQANTSGDVAKTRANDYQGLPAKFELPSGVRFGSFTEQMLAADRPQNVTIVLLSMTLVTWLAVVFAVAGAWLLWRDRETIRTTLRTRLAVTAPETIPA